MSRFMRRTGWYLLGDLIIVVVAYRVALTGRFAGASPNEHYLQAWNTYIAFIVFIHLAANYWAGMYSRLWRFASAPDALIVVQAWLGATIPLMLMDMLPAARLEPTIRPLPLSALALGGFLAAAGLTMLRYRTRVLVSLIFRLRRAGQKPPGGAGPIRTLIVGAGETGQSLSWQLQNRRGGRAYQVLGFIDDDADIHGFNVHGIPILGGRAQLLELVVLHNVDLIVLAIHAISGHQFREILSVCQNAPARIQIVPDVFEELATSANKSLLRDVTVDDFLGRSPAEIDIEVCRDMLQGSTVLVTGGAGSIGTELCRQALAFDAKLVVAVDMNETGLYELQAETSMMNSQCNLNVCVADVTDSEQVSEIFKRYRPEVVFHTAAYKHVPLMESHPRVALRTNVVGTLNVGLSAREAGSERFVLISTDKAVEPASIYGVTKLIAEQVTASLAVASSDTLFACVRFGNVLGSRGSVVPLFEKQIAAGGPITVTHPDITRFYMTIPEAVRLVIQASALTRGGDLFMLEMGESIRIAELAERMIRLHGLRPEVDIQIEFTGLRPGEKLHEELIENEESREATDHAQIYRVLSGRRKSNKLDLALLEQWVYSALDLPENDLEKNLRSYSSDGVINQPNSYKRK
jgi:FlaA1/EpsC-like NDP-sugar epimerase